MLINLSNRNKDLGLLLLRIGIGGAFILIHGFPKITGGPELWKGLGSTMGNLGITFMPEFWGLLSALAEFGGGILLLLGLFTRPAAFLMAFNMVVALTMHFTNLDPWSKIAHPLELAAVLLAVLIAGAGKYSLDYLLSSKKHVIIKYVKPITTKRASVSDAVRPVI